MRVPDRHRRERDAVDRLHGADDDLADVLLELAALESMRVHDGTLADDDLDAGGARAGSEPRGRDPRAVTRELGLRAVGVPDGDLDAIVGGIQNLEHTIRVSGQLHRIVGRQRRGERCDDDVRVTRRAPDR